MSLTPSFNPSFRPSLTSLAIAAGLTLAAQTVHAQQAIVREAPLRAHLSLSLIHI